MRFSSTRLTWAFLKPEIVFWQEWKKTTLPSPTWKKGNHSFIQNQRSQEKHRRLWEKTQRSWRCSWGQKNRRRRQEEIRDFISKRQVNGRILKLFWQVKIQLNCWTWQVGEEYHWNPWTDRKSSLNFQPASHRTFFCSQQSRQESKYNCSSKSWVRNQTQQSSRSWKHRKTNSRCKYKYIQ